MGAAAVPCAATAAAVSGSAGARSSAAASTAACGGDAAAAWPTQRMVVTQSWGDVMLEAGPVALAVCSFLDPPDLARLALCSNSAARAVRAFLRCGGDVAGAALLPGGAWSEETSEGSGRLLAAALRPVDGMRELIAFWQELCGGENDDRVWHDDETTQRILSGAHACSTRDHRHEEAEARAAQIEGAAAAAKFFLPELACACMWHTGSRQRLLQHERALSVLWVARLSRPRLAQIAPRDWVHRGYRVTGALMFFLSCFKWRIPDFFGARIQAEGAPRRLHSPPFVAGGHRWRLVLYPNATPRPGSALMEDDDQGESCISLFLERLAPADGGGGEVPATEGAGEGGSKGKRASKRRFERRRAAGAAKPVRAFFSLAVCHNAPLTAAGNAEPELSQQYHLLSTCDDCGEYPLTERYKGTAMSDFDLCGKCYAARVSRLGCLPVKSDLAVGEDGGPDSHAAPVQCAHGGARSAGNGAGGSSGSGRPPNDPAANGFLRIEAPTSHVLTSEHVFTEGKDWGFPEYLSHSTARIFADANDGALVLEAHVTVEDAHGSPAATSDDGGELDALLLQAVEA